MKLEQNDYEKLRHVYHPGSFVRQLVDSSGLTVTDAAKRLGIGRVQLTRVMQKQSGLSPELALRIEKVFGFPADDALFMQMAYDLQKARGQAPKGIKRLDGVFGEHDVYHVVDVLRTHKKQLAKAKIKSVTVFGSVARGTAKPTSDIDLLVEIEGLGDTVNYFGGLQTALDALQSLFFAPVDITETPVKDDYLKSHIEKEGVVAF